MFDVNHRKRLLFACYHFYLDPSNGASITAREMLLALAKRGWEVTTFCGCGLDFHHEHNPLQLLADRNILVWLRYVSRVVGDLLLIAGDDAFRMANMYYASVRAATRSNLPEAEQVFQLLNLFWRKRRTNEEPTEQEVMRDALALLRGRKDGRVVIENESDQVVKGEKVVIDNTQKKPRGGVKIVERGEVTEE